jgi:AcrR family transcriptional regulator
MKAEMRRALHREELRTEILDAAREIFVKDGYDGFSMRKLAHIVEYSPAAIYLHFENKKQLFDILVEQSFAHLHTALGTLLDEREKDPVRQLKRGLRLYVEWGLRHPNEYSIAFLVRKPSKQKYQTHQAFEVARSLVKLCLKGSRVSGREVELRTQAVWAAIHGITSLLVQIPAFPWISKDRLIDQVIDSAISGVIDRQQTLKGRGKSNARRL